MRSGVQGADNDRVLYWPLAIAIGCPVVCILAWSDTFLVQLICGSFTPLVTFVSLIIDAAACKSGGVVCSLAWITDPFILAGLLSLIIGPLAFGVWLGAGVVVPLIAVMGLSSLGAGSCPSWFCRWFRWLRCTMSSFSGAPDTLLATTFICLPDIPATWPKWQNCLPMSRGSRCGNGTSTDR